ncbi:tRNA pseudouridine(55) synthase TruB [Patescibacteria group bacterium]|nr:tRNA pseudouridine(55) synthase TruB [Patescibacteria group bacterium]
MIPLVLSLNTVQNKKCLIKVVFTTMEFDFEKKEGFLVIDKPTGWTSHDVVAKMRGVLGVKKIGHLGTLDPLATGVLVLAVGRSATKQVASLMKVSKDYDCTMELGKVSDTYDSEGKVEETGVDLSGLTEAKICKVMEKFWGKTMQTPPAFSAKKIGGRKAYELARKGEEVKLEPKEVEMEGREIQFDSPLVHFKVEVSSGTYVRSLVHDIGETLGCGAVLVALKRLRVGDFKIEDAMTIEEVIAAQ